MRGEGDRRKGEAVGAGTRARDEGGGRAQVGGDIFVERTIRHHHAHVQCAHPARCDRHIFDQFVGAHLYFDIRL